MVTRNLGCWSHCVGILIILTGRASAQPVSPEWAEQRGRLAETESDAFERAAANFASPSRWNDLRLCGPNSMYIIARVLGVQVTRDQIDRVVTANEWRGASLHELQVAGAAIGVPLDIRFVSEADLINLRPPFIMHLARSDLPADDGHFVVVFDYDPASKRPFGIIDGSSGQRYYSDLRYFVRSFSGYVAIPRRFSIAWFASGWGAVIVLLGVLEWRDRRGRHATNSTVGMAVPGDERRTAAVQGA